MNKDIYEVFVGNVGRVCCSHILKAANGVYQEYKRLSMDGYGRAANEQVTLFKNSEPIKEWLPFEIDEEEN